MTTEEKIARTIRWAATRAIGTPHMPVEEVIKHATADAMRVLRADPLTYPPDGGLRAQVRPYGETPSVFSVLKQHFFPTR